MSKLTIGRMAKLYGLHRSTLYEAVDKGRVTAGPNGKGQQVIDLSEMIRVYGEPPSRPTLLPDTSTPPGDTGPTLTEWRELVAEMRLLREEVAGLRETLLRIEHKPEPEATGKPAPAPGQAPGALWKHHAPPPKSIADILAGWE